MDPLDSEDGDLYEALDRLKKQPYLEPDPEKRRLCSELLASYRKAESERIFRIQTETAIAKGFSSREQLLEHEREEERQREINQETYMMKKAAELGITYAELYAQEYPQPDRCIRRYRPRCDCESRLQILKLDYCLFRVIQNIRYLFSALELFSVTDRWTHQILWSFWNFDVVQI